MSILDDSGVLRELNGCDRQGYGRMLRKRNPKNAVIDSGKQKAPQQRSKRIPPTKKRLQPIQDKENKCTDEVTVAPKKTLPSKKKQLQNKEDAGLHQQVSVKKRSENVASTTNITDKIKSPTNKEITNNNEPSSDKNVDTRKTSPDIIENLQQLSEEIISRIPASAVEVSFVEVSTDTDLLPFVVITEDVLNSQDLTNVVKQSQKNSILDELHNENTKTTVNQETAITGSINENTVNEELNQKCSIAEDDGNNNLPELLPSNQMTKTFEDLTVISDVEQYSKKDKTPSTVDDVIKSVSAEGADVEPSGCTPKKKSKHRKRNSSADALDVSKPASIIVIDDEGIESHTKKKSKHRKRNSSADALAVSHSASIIVPENDEIDESHTKKKSKRRKHNSSADAGDASNSVCAENDDDEGSESRTKEKREKKLRKKKTHSTDDSIDTDSFVVDGSETRTKKKSKHRKHNSSADAGDANSHSVSAENADDDGSESRTKEKREKKHRKKKIQSTVDDTINSVIDTESFLVEDSEFPPNEKKKRKKRKRSNTVDNSASVQKEQTDDEGTVTGKDDIAVLSTTKKKDKQKCRRASDNENIENESDDVLSATNLLDYSLLTDDVHSARKSSTQLIEPVDLTDQVFNCELSQIPIHIPSSNKHGSQYGDMSDDDDGNNSSSERNENHEKPDDPGTLRSLFYSKKNKPPSKEPAQLPHQQSQFLIPATSILSKAVGQTNNHDRILMGYLAKQLKSIMSGISANSSAIQKMQESMSSVATSAHNNTSNSSGYDSNVDQTDVPKVRDAFRKCYRKSNNKWTFGKKLNYKSPVNLDLTNAIMDDVLAVNPNVSMDILHAVARRTFVSQRERLAIIRRSGGMAAHNRKQQLYQRKYSKLKKRQEALPECGFSVRRASAIASVLKYEMISSEESGGEDDDGVKTFAIKVYPWHSKTYRKRIKKIDTKANELEHSIAKRMRWSRKPGSVSKSIPPAFLKEEDAWVIAEDWSNET